MPSLGGCYTGYGSYLFLIEKFGLFSFALGGTPYPEIKKRDIGIRVMRGLRLPQTQYISEDLYQLMLGCWMTDPDERPTPVEVQETLRTSLDGLLNIGSLGIKLDSY